MKKDSVEVLEKTKKWIKKEISKPQGQMHEYDNGCIGDSDEWRATIKALQEAIDLMKAVKVVDGVFPRELKDENTSAMSDFTCPLHVTHKKIYYYNIGELGVNCYNQAIKDCKTAMAQRLVAIAKEERELMCSKESEDYVRGFVDCHTSIRKHMGGGR